ncbi:MAG TPA: hypothetical protein VGM80_10275 [Gaiellaceae bacterium]
MRSFLVFVASGLGVGAIWRRRRRRPVAALPYAGPIDADAVEDDGPDHAAALRAKLAESKAASSDDGERAATGEVSEPAVTTESDGPDARRRDVHDRARASIDELG